MIPKYPTLLKIGEYELEKDNFKLTHKYQVVASGNVKRRFEYPCDECTSIYVTSIGNERRKSLPWICRSCRSKKLWSKEEYRAAVTSYVDDDLRRERAKQMKERSLAMWQDPAKREEISKKLRERDPEVYSRGKKKMRTAAILIHWKDKRELVCIGSYEKAFVEWANKHQIDFDWQIPHKMPDGRTYIVDAFIKTGDYANTWVEIKGYLREIGKSKWEWFHREYTNSVMWTKPILKQLEIL